VVAALTALLIAALVAMANFAAWWKLNPPQAAVDAPMRATGLAYNAYQRWESPLTRRYPTNDEIASDLQLLAPVTGRLRTYSSLEFPALPAAADEQGLRIAAGAWLDRRLDNNELEIEAAIAAARTHGNVERLIVGNETQLHGKLTPRELHAYLDRVRAAADVPVSTAEPWHVWLRQPELARHVDFITIHLLPYWEGVPVEAAVDEALLRYAQVQARFPGRKVVIGEIGWPSGGEAVGVALATPDRQARFLREFLARTAGSDLDYYLMEAVDQPWKRATEGPVGAHWGMFDAARGAKFAPSGPVYERPYWRTHAALAAALGFGLAFAFGLRFARMRLAGRVAFALAAQLVASLGVVLLSAPLVDYLRAADSLMLLWLVPGLALMAAILLAQAFEFAELFWDGSLRRRTAARPLPEGVAPPCVSIHLACCNEPPEMVIATIDSLLALDWPDFEILVVDNNTRDAARWRPVQAHVESVLAARARRGVHGPALRFFHLPQWPGYKAGALNFALEHTDARAQWVGVVDADYVVRPDWLRAVAGHFADVRNGIVQSPQAHREWGGELLRRMMNWEYEGFFRIGMHHRHERDAIVQHGTMTLIRASTLRAAGGWSSDTVCEDTELGLRVLQAGQRAVYVDEVLGTGLVPADFGAYRRQRHRWAQGAMQILRRHSGALFGRSGLSLGQRYHFVAGWLPWLGDALHLVFTVAAIAWTLLLLAAPQWFAVPLALFVVPLAVFLLVRLGLGPLLYWRRVPCGPGDIAGASLAGMGLSHTIARGVFAGLLSKEAVFKITRKAAGRAPRASWLAPVREEAGLFAALLACITVLAWRREPGDVAVALWIGVLAMQALPYAAALACAAISARGRGQLASRPKAHRDAREAEQAA
jgi:exo-beta-1,3-glucanase (GH17 family)/cellulose synthase/poly-beta-1,6-N-acetylglucosamine synthase-like glycosyltransferase